MTLIAALKIEGVPALIGDFLVTDNRRSAGHDWIPTQPYLNDPNYPNKLQRRISGAKRKLHLINDYFIVGFTGYVDAGAAIFSALESRFGSTKRGPPIIEISRALESFNIHIYKKATVIGWTAGPKPRCFKWTAKPGSTATHVTHAIEGSRSRHFAELLTNARSGGYPAGMNSAFEKAILPGLAKVGGILTEELGAATIVMTDRRPTRRPRGGTVKENLEPVAGGQPVDTREWRRRSLCYPLSDERPGRARIKRVERQRRG